MRHRMALLSTLLLIGSGCGGGARVGVSTATTIAPSSPSAPPPTTSGGVPPVGHRPTRVPVPRPRIVQWWIPFGAQRKRETAAYALHHYGIDTYQLLSPHVIVEHVSDAGTASADFNTFAADVPDVELHELPGVCAHFVIDTDGTIYQMVPTSIICRHTVGLNYTAIGIEHVGFTDGDVLHNPRQLAASLELTRFLRCRFHIRLRDVIGHNESLSSPYHHELVASLRSQTHDDFKHSSMVAYRRALAGRGGC